MLAALDETHFHRAPRQDGPISKFGRNPGYEIFVEQDASRAGGGGIFQCFRLEEVFVGGNSGWKRLELNLLDGTSRIKHAGCNRPGIAFPPCEERTGGWLGFAEDIAEKRDRFFFGRDDVSADGCLMKRAPRGACQNSAD